MIIHVRPDIKPKNLSVKLSLFPYPSVQICVLGDQKNCLIETVLLSTRNISFSERSVSVVECLTRDRGATGSSLTGITALWSLSKTHLS